MMTNDCSNCSASGSEECYIVIVVVVNINDFMMLTNISNIVEPVGRQNSEQF